MLAEGYGSNENGALPSSHRKTGFARYAAVSKEWQAFFEKIIYRSLVLQTTCLDAFDKITRHRQNLKGLVEHIRLCIELKGTYDCTSCLDFAEPLRGIADYETVPKTFTKLFLILSTWQKHEVALFYGGLTLDLSMYSPSDSQHAFSGDFHLGPDLFETEDTRRQKLSVHDLYHGWNQGQRSARPPMAAISKLLSFVCSDFQKGILPSVKVVRSLVLRRQTRHTFSPRSFQQVLESLPDLECIIYEPWRDFFRFPWKDMPYLRDSGKFNNCSSSHLNFGDNAILTPTMTEYRDIILLSLPPQLKTLTIFEDFNEDYNIVHCFNWIAATWPCPPEFVRTPWPCVGAALAYTSFGLEKLSVSYMIDAKDFFAACRAPQPCNKTWDKLTSLSLTSRLLTVRKPKDPSPIIDMLLDAGAVALRMPKLRTMEIWNGMKRNACTFRYQVTTTSTTLSWRGTWHLELDSGVVDVWEKVALRFTRNKLSALMSEILDKQDIKSHAHAVHELKLTAQVAHPVSLEQIKRESGRRFYQ